MYRAVVLLVFVVFGANLYANNCDFKKGGKGDCQISEDNLPIFEHKFIDGDEVSRAYTNCIYDGKIETFDGEYEVIDCSLAEYNNLLTEEVILPKKDINFKNDNILIRFAGNLVLNDGIKINSKNPKNIIIELINNSYGESSLIINGNSTLNAKSIIIPEGKNSKIVLNDCVNKDDVLKIQNFYSIKGDSGSLGEFRNQIVCNKPKDTPKLAEKPQDSQKSKPQENIEVADAKIQETQKLKETQNAQKSDEKSNENLNEKPDEKKVAEFLNEDSNVEPKNVESKNAENDMKIADSSKSSEQAEIPNKDSTKSSQNIESKTEQDTQTNQLYDENLTQDENLNDENLEDEQNLAQNSDQTTELKQDEIVEKVNLNDEFLIIERDSFDSANRKCKNDINCLYNELKSYDKMVQSKFSSKNKIYQIYVLNLRDEMSVDCKIENYAGNNSVSYDLDSNNFIGKIDLNFPNSTAKKPKIICSGEEISKETNEFEVIPAKVIIEPEFKSVNLDSTPTVKAGDIEIFIGNSRALTLEGESDNGFNGTLVSDKITFTQDRVCQNIDDKLKLKNPIMIDFENGKPKNDYITFFANVMTKGELNINFNTKDSTNCDDKSTKCLNATLKHRVNIIPHNFTLESNIVSESGVAYYGQLDDRNSFKQNPLINLKISAINNNGDEMDLDSACNYGFVELELESKSLLEFKKNITDRLNSKISIYLSDFDESSVDFDVYFGISKIIDKYKSLRKIQQNDLIEPREIGLEDFKFSLRLKNNDTFYDYDNIRVSSDRTTHNSVLITRGKLKLDDISGSTKDGANLIAKYLIYCENCNTKLLEKYLELTDLTMEETNWYVNTKHPEDIFIKNDNIKTKLKIDNSNKAFEGLQEINLKGKSGKYDVSIDQRGGSFAPYLNYNEKYKNTYIPNSFSVVLEGDDKLFKDEIKVEKPKEPEVKKEAPKIESPKVEKPKNTNKPKPTPKPAPKKSNDEKLDIED